MLDVKGLNAGYGEVSVLRDVTLHCETGTVVALLGPNGAGKTTFLHTVSGFIRPASGTVMLGGEDITNWKPAKIARAGVCHIPEGRGFSGPDPPRQPPPVRPQGKVDEAIERAASSFPTLGKGLKQTAGSLSGGEQQMLAVVRGYLTDPKLVLVDEASMGLAPLRRRRAVGVPHLNRQVRNHAAHRRAVRVEGTQAGRHCLPAQSRAHRLHRPRGRVRER
jgi:branched-chain amino acid transport system ATP-binding protein